MSLLDINNTVMDFQSAAIRCLESGFQVLELHMAHGYLMHQFLSPISNQRDDDYGGCYDNRVRFPLAVARAVRNVWPDNLPLFVRISATDWADGRQELMTLSEKSPPRSNAWNLLESIAFSRQLKDLGMDLIDCSSGGTLASADIPIEPGYQVPFSEMIKKECGIMTAAVGLITDPQQAESILQKQQADAVFLGRELLRNPYWVIDSSSYFGIPMPPPNQYKRAYE
jgi:2,4-dienoyl-CoA reductase-like NADH-dependent reductase (Old Yellow Enzyme family)